ncbi:MAG: 30S ribosomal protein S18 [Patescibacteria group bacterium]|jgi:small subunit ribosomal protein S18|nr:30S ribosomal protein S18 [Patescibacteria group bacterium]
MSNSKNKECYFCANNMEVDYKDVRTLKKFVNFFMKVLPGSRTGVCAWHQRKLSKAVKRARVMSLLSATHK